MEEKPTTYRIPAEVQTWRDEVFMPFPWSNRTLWGRYSYTHFPSDRTGSGRLSKLSSQVRNPDPSYFRHMPSPATQRLFSYFLNKKFSSWNLHELLLESGHRCLKPRISTKERTNIWAHDKAWGFVILWAKYDYSQGMSWRNWSSLRQSDLPKVTHLESCGCSHFWGLLFLSPLLNC